jgi:radical SAM protein with 4Fe4S-binding SPASM domain
MAIVRNSDNPDRYGVELRDRVVRLFRALSCLARGPLAREAAVNNFLKEFSYTHGLLKNLGYPQVYQLETTNHCPYTCIMCPRTHAMTRPLGHMDIGLFRSIIDQLRPAWQIDRSLSEPSIGLWHFGEPVVYRHFVESIVYCHDRGLNVCISTNPSAWTERRIDQMLDTGVDELYVMIDGMDDDTSIAIRGTAASFTRGERNIRDLVHKKVTRGLTKPHVYINMVKQPRNAHQWQQFKSYWFGIEGIDRVHLGGYSTFAGDLVQLNKIGDDLVSRDKEQESSDAHHIYMSRFPCFYPWHSISVTWEGKVVPCCRDYNASDVLGDLRFESLEDIWNGARMRQLRFEHSRGKVTASLCVNCKERSSEIGLPGRFYPISKLLRSLTTRKAKHHRPVLWNRESS